MKTKTGQNKFLRILTIPFRALGKAYVRSMTSYATKVGYGAEYAGTTAAASYGGGAATSLPKSFSAHVSRSTDNDDLRELIRAASVRSMAEKMDVNPLILEHQLGMMQRKELRPPAPPPAAAKGMMPPRSVSVGMARIDEDKPESGGAAVESGGGKGSSKKGFGMGRSKSYAVNKRPNPYSF